MVCCLMTAGTAQAADPDLLFNDYIVKAAQELYKTRKGLGYNKSKAFTRDIPYGSKGADGKTPEVKATAPTDTMCVAASAETAVTALNDYLTTGDKTPFTRIPATSWSRHPDYSTLQDIRPYFFAQAVCNCEGKRYWTAKYGATPCDPGDKKRPLPAQYKVELASGSAQAFERFGMGKVTSFEQLTPGGFINLNRDAGSGHSVVFLRFIAKRGDGFETVAAYEPSVVGFKYFSSQGSPKPGMDYRFAFFGKGPCATGGLKAPIVDNSRLPNEPTEQILDCGVLKAPLAAGVMYHPKHWTTEQAAKDLNNWLLKDVKVIGCNLPPSSKITIEGDLGQFSERVQGNMRIDLEGLSEAKKQVLRNDGISTVFAASLIELDLRRPLPPPDVSKYDFD